MRYQLPWPAALICTALLAGAAARAVAQSLADVARQEAERRKTISEPSKVYTERDLKAVPPPIPQPAGASAAVTLDGAPPDAAASDAAADGAPATEGTAADAADAAAPENASGQAEWAAGMRERQEKLERDRVLLDSVQNRLNSLNADFTARDDPAQRELIAQDRQRSLDELDRLRRDIVADEQAISQYEEDARRAGVPAGWLRN